MARVALGIKSSSRLSSPEMSVKLWLASKEAGSIGETRVVTEWITFEVEATACEPNNKILSSGWHKGGNKEVEVPDCPSANVNSETWNRKFIINYILDFKIKK